MCSNPFTRLFIFFALILLLGEMQGQGIFRDARVQVQLSKKWKLSKKLDLRLNQSIQYNPDLSLLPWLDNGIDDPDLSDIDFVDPELVGNSNTNYGCQWEPEEEREAGKREQSGGGDDDDDDDPPGDDDDDDDDPLSNDGSGRDTATSFEEPNDQPGAREVRGEEVEQAQNGQPGISRSNCLPVVDSVYVSPQGLAEEPDEEPERVWDNLRGASSLVVRWKLKKWFLLEGGYMFSLRPGRNSHRLFTDLIFRKTIWEKLRADARIRYQHDFAYDREDQEWDRRNFIRVRGQAQLNTQIRPSLQTELIYRIRGDRSRWDRFRAALGLSFPIAEKHRVFLQYQYQYRIGRDSDAHATALSLGIRFRL